MNTVVWSHNGVTIHVTEEEGSEEEKGKVHKAKMGPAEFFIVERARGEKRSRELGGEKFLEGAALQMHN